MAKSNMYADFKSWSPFVGCKFDCVYCKASWQAQLKRFAGRLSCKDDKDNCHNYLPHYHPDRLLKIPSIPNIFVCGSGDISFCDPDYVRQIIQAIKSKPDKTFYFQSKEPNCFKPFLKEFPSNVILVATLETNRDDGYEKISKAPKPSERYKQFLSLKYPRKVITIEPLLDFDLDIFLQWIRSINPEYVWIGLNSKRNRKALKFLPEPSKEKIAALMAGLRGGKIEWREKTLQKVIGEIPVKEKTMR